MKIQVMAMTKLDERICQAESIVILGHVHPDGDCVGSSLGMYNYIRENYPQIPVQVYLEPFPESFRFLSGADRVSSEFTDGKRYDLCLALDASDRERLGEAGVYFDTAARTLCIDHHITNTGYAEENIVHPEASSVSEVIACRMEKEKISQKTAECLYLGIVHDTGVFKHSNTSEKTMQTAGMLLAKGVSSSRIIDDTFYKKTFTQNQLLGQALLRARLYLEGFVAGSFLTAEDMARFGGSPKDMDGIVDQLRVTDGVEAAVFLYETGPSQFKISMRSNQIVDVSRIASAFGGGGHVRAAGGSATGDPEEILQQVVHHIEEQHRETDGRNSHY